MTWPTKSGMKGDFVAAIPFFERAISLYPSFAMAYVLLGMMQWNFRQENSAKNHL